MQSMYLSSIAYELGHQVPIEYLELPQPLLEKFMAASGGLQYFCKSEHTGLELARRSVLKTLQKSGLAGDQIDSVILTSNSLLRTCHWTDVTGMLLDLGLVNAKPLYVNAGDCCNFQVAVKLCHGLIHTDQAKTILLINVDTAKDFAQVDDPQFVSERISIREAGINSDGASSCILGADVQEGFRLSGMPVHTNDMTILAPGNNDTGFVQVFNMARQLFKSLYEKESLDFGEAVKPESFSTIVTNNYTLDVIDLIAMAARVSMEKVYTDNVGTVAHCFASDNLINLHDCCQRGSLQQDDRILVVGSGVSQWSAFVAERCVRKTN